LFLQRQRLTCAVWLWIRTWQGATATAVSAVAAIYYGPRKMLEGLDWYLERFRDRRVLQSLKKRRLFPQAGGFGAGSTRNPLPTPLKFPILSKN